MSFYFGIQVSFFKDRQGLKLTYKFRLLKLKSERIWILKQNPSWGKGNPERTPKFEHPGILTEMPMGREIQPEDM